MGAGSSVEGAETRVEACFKALETSGGGSGQLDNKELSAAFMAADPSLSKFDAALQSRDWIKEIDGSKDRKVKYKGHEVGLGAKLVYSLLSPHALRCQDRHERIQALP